MEPIIDLNADLRQPGEVGRGDFLRVEDKWCEIFFNPHEGIDEATPPDIIFKTVEYAKSSSGETLKYIQIIREVKAIQIQRYAFRRDIIRAPERISPESKDPIPRPRPGASPYGCRYVRAADMAFNKFNRKWYEIYSNTAEGLSRKRTINRLNVTITVIEMVDGKRVFRNLRSHWLELWRRSDLINLPPSLLNKNELPRLSPLRKWV